MKPSTMFLIAGGAVLMAVTGKVVWDRVKVAGVLADEFERVGLPRAWGIALGIQESDLDPKAHVGTGPDGARGGAFGVTQITEKTARAWGYTGPMEDLYDPRVAARLTADMAAAGWTGSAALGMPLTLEDLGSIWNAGRRFSDPKLPSVTRTKYVPRLRASLAAAQVIA